MASKKKYYWIRLKNDFLVMRWRIDKEVFNFGDNFFIFVQIKQVELYEIYINTEELENILSIYESYYIIGIIDIIKIRNIKYLRKKKGLI